MGLLRRSSTPLLPISTPIDFIYFVPVEILANTEDILWSLSKVRTRPRSSAFRLAYPSCGISRRKRRLCLQPFMLPPAVGPDEWNSYQLLEKRRTCCGA